MLIVRERETDRQRQTDRQTKAERETETQRGRDRQQTERQREIEREQTDRRRQTDRQTEEALEVESKMRGKKGKELWNDFSFLHIQSTTCHDSRTQGWNTTDRGKRDAEIDKEREWRGWPWDCDG